MGSSEKSIFDLSVSEKLQLLEDLWDDIASNPAAVLLRDWQKAELDRRKKNLLRNPAQDSCMTAELLLAPEVEQDVSEAYN